MACSSMRTSYTRCVTWECGSTGGTSSRWELGRDRNRTDKWWRDFLQDSGGAGFWHATYMRHGGVEAVYMDMKEHVGLAKFAPVVTARGAMFSARRIAGLTSEGGQARI